MSRKVTLRIDVDTNLNLSARCVGDLVYRLINAGLEDARQTIENGEGDFDNCAVIEPIRRSTR